jgi:hypothetical protein
VATQAAFLFVYAVSRRRSLGAETCRTPLRVNDRTSSFNDTSTITATRYPEIKIEITVDYGLSTIVADGYDAGVRSGEQVAKDMIAVRIGPDLRMAVVGTPSYFRKRPEPTKPQDLIRHNCINLRLPSHGGFIRVGV